MKQAIEFVLECYDTAGQSKNDNEHGGCERDDQVQVEDEFAHSFVLQRLADVSEASGKKGVFDAHANLRPEQKDHDRNTE